MEWNEKGEMKKVRIYTEAAHKWMEIGQNLGLENGVLEGFDRDGHNNYERVTKVLGEWMSNASNLPRCNQYPRTWSGLIQLLDVSGLGDLAGRVSKALSEYDKQK